MSDEATISLNPAKASELDFEVTVQGLDDDEPPVVRFVIIGGKTNYDHSFRCSRIEDEKHGWNVKLPVLDHIAGDIISNVSIIDNNRVRLVLSETLPDGATLSYAKGRTAGSQSYGNLRDVDDANGYTINNQKLHLHNWCVMFEYLVN